MFPFSLWTAGLDSDLQTISNLSLCLVQSLVFSLFLSLISNPLLCRLLMETIFHKYFKRPNF